MKEPGHADSYEGLVIDFKPGKKPHLIIEDDAGEELERIDLAPVVDGRNPRARAEQGLRAPGAAGRGRRGGARGAGGGRRRRRGDALVLCDERRRRRDDGRARASSETRAARRWTGGAQ